MILPASTALPAAAGLLLRGCWDPWAQALVHAGTAAGLSGWVLWRVLRGHVPLASRRNLSWAAALAALAMLSSTLSPVSGLSTPELYNFLNALWIFPAMSALSKDERTWVDQAVRAAAWALVLLAVYQRWGLGDARPASALVNQNVWAGTILMLLPLAAERGDKLLAAGLILSLWWTKSVGAWLGLFAALAVTSRWRRGRWSWVGVAGCLVCLVAIYNKFESPEVLNRWRWWAAAARMIAERPLLGFGPGSYAYVFPAYRGEGTLSTLYAHQYPLQVMAEHGLPFAALWFAGLWHCLARGRSYKRFGALAVLIHSCWDWPLSMPANLWLFSYMAASSLPEEDHAVNVRARRKVPLALAAAAAGAFLCWRSWALWEADRCKARAQAALSEGRIEEALLHAERAIVLAPRDPSARLLSAAASFRLGRRDPAARQLERAAALNPFRPGARAELEAVRAAGP